MKVEINEQTGDLKIMFNDSDEPIVIKRDPHIIMQFLTINKLDDLRLRMQVVMNHIAKQLEEEDNE